MRSERERGALGRRAFLRAGGLLGCGLAAAPGRLLTLPWVAGRSGDKTPATVRCAFLYPPSESLQGGWWSWPGNDFDAEGRQQLYTRALREIEAKLGMDIRVHVGPLDSPASVRGFIEQVRRAQPDGLLLVPFKASHFAQTDDVIRAVGMPGQIPTVVFTCLGVKHGSISKYFRPGCHIISSLDNLDALAYAMRMFATARWMREARILSLAGQEELADTVEPCLGTTIRRLPVSRFVERVDGTQVTPEVRELAEGFRERACEVREPQWPEILTAARVHVALCGLIAEEDADAVMMQCLDRGEYQPCTSFMTLRDAGTPAGCENDLGATLTLMLVQRLFDRPGFQHNPCFETEANHYFASHCTCPTRLRGPEAPASPYLLRNYAHTNFPTCVPQVMWPEGEPVTMAHYLGGDPPSVLVYSGEVVRSYAMPPVGGCRTNVEVTVNELAHATDVKGHHNVLFCGDHAEQVRTYCRLFGLTATV